MTRKRTVAVVALAAHMTLAGVAHADLTADQTPFHTYRGVWVSRFEYSNTAASVDSIFANAQALGITDVMFQVRGQADAYYVPKLVNGNYFERRVSTSFDALARAIQQGQQRGIKVHAWLNAMPLWNGPTLPTDQPGNPYVINTHPEYWIRDSTNTPQPLNSGYVIVNPTMPEVKNHLYQVVDDITSKYNVDGIHLDYIRYYNVSSGSNPIVYPTDPASVARFQSIPGNAGKTPTSHKAEYQQWMADNITEIVAGVRQAMKANKPDAQLTAAVWRDANIGFNDYQQEWRAWTDRGLLDAAMPMIYRKGFGTGGTNMDSDSGNLYRNNVTSGVNWRGTAGIMPGIGTYLQDNPATAYNNVTAQLNFAREQGANGVQIFSYTDLLGGNAVDLEVRRAWLDFVAANSAAPPVADITNFETDEGYFPTNITFSGSNINVASNSTADRTTAEARSGIASQQLTINKTAGAGTFLARHVSGIGTPANPNSNLEFASIGAIGFWLKTETPDVEVAIALDDRADNTSTERSYFQNVISDGQWHRYEWFLNDPTHWTAWAGANRDGKIDARFWLDSIQFRGSESANILFLDDVFFDAAAVAPNQWSLDSAVNVNSLDSKWTNGANWQGGIPNAPGAAANFLRRATGPQNVELDATVTVERITFDNSNPYTITGGGTIRLDAAPGGSAGITVRNRGTHNIQIGLQLIDDATFSVDHQATLNLTGLLDNSTGRTITRTGNGILNIDGPQAHGPGTALDVIAGTTNLNTNAGSPSDRNVELSAFGTQARVNLNASQHLAAVAASDGARIHLNADFIHTGSARPTTGGRIDLDTGAMIVDYTGSTPLAQVTADIASAYNGGDWSGSGITSDTAAQNAANPSAPRTALGIAEATDLFVSFPATFAGQSVDATSVLIRYTLSGDANLDRTVNIADFSLLAANFNAPAGWSGGDFNYDGTVGIADFALLAANFNQSLPAPIARGVAVPEPATGLVACVGVLLALGAGCRRRRG